MKRIPILFFLPVLVVAAGVLAADPARFFTVVDDLPVMAGLSEVGEGVHFEGPQGRIAEGTAEGSATATQVLDFYGAALPQLGWKALGSGEFVREGETLSLKAEDLGGGRVRLSLTVRPFQGP